MAILQRHKSIIFGLNDSLASLNDLIAAETLARNTQAGSLSSLSTTNQASLVQAINEVFGLTGGVTLDSLQKDANLSDVVSLVDARTNLDVYSVTEINDAIAEAKIALGTSYSVANITERDALANLDLQDRIFVQDSGTGKWALYKPQTIDGGTGAVTAWTLLADQEALETSISAPALKTAYESNPDTNAYTDAAKAKVDYLTVTGAIDLDQAILKTALIQDLQANSGADKAASVDGIKAYALGTASVGGPKAMLESVTVTGDTITLTHEPRNGLEGVMNFGTVRYIDGNSVAYDAPLQATANPNQFIVLTDTMEQWNGFSVKVQYVYLDAKSLSPT
jgi:hypothetical protein